MKDTLIEVLLAVRRYIADWIVGFVSIAIALTVFVLLSFGAAEVVKVFGLEGVGRTLLALIGGIIVFVLIFVFIPLAGRDLRRGP